MAAPLVKTSTPGIYKRGSRYVVVFYFGGKQRRESARTLAEARKLKAKRTAQVTDGEFYAQTRVTFAEYSREWVERYRGRGRRGFREGTRDDYRRLLDAYALRFFPPQTRLSQITPRHVAQFVGWLCEQPSARGTLLSDSSVRNALNPVRACLATATAEGLIRHNPTVGASLPHRVTAEDVEAEEALTFSRDQLAAFLRQVATPHRLMFDFLACTGLRVSELVGLQWRHLQLEAPRLT